MSCSKPVVEVTARFSTNKDVYQTGEELIVQNTSEVKNNTLAFCKWEYNEQVHYGLELDGLSFANPGLYTITLTAYAEQGAGQDSYSRQILVVEENDIPWANFNCPPTVRVGEEVLFEDKSVDNIGGITTWAWNIGGKTYSSDSPIVVFDSPATGVAVTLTVTDALGAVDSITKTIDITL